MDFSPQEHIARDGAKLTIHYKTAGAGDSGHSARIFATAPVAGWLLFDLELLMADQKALLPRLQPSYNWVVVVLELP